jgi:hypothetical protein
MTSSLRSAALGKTSVAAGLAVLAAGIAVAAAPGAQAAPPRTEPVTVHCDTAHYYANYDQSADKFYGEQADTVARGGTMNRRIETPFEGPRGVVVFHVDQWYFTSRACLG